MRSKCKTEVKVKVWVSQSCLTLCNPMDCSPPGSSVQGILQARILEWVTIPFSKRPCRFTSDWGWRKSWRDVGTGLLLPGGQDLPHFWPVSPTFCADIAPRWPPFLLPKVKMKLLPHVHSFSCVSGHSAKVDWGSVLCQCLCWVLGTQWWVKIKMVPAPRELVILRRRRVLIQDRGGTEVDEPRDCRTEWSKSEWEKPILYITAYIWNLEKWY